MLGMAAPLASAGLGGKTRLSWSTDSIVFVAMQSSGRAVFRRKLGSRRKWRVPAGRAAPVFGKWKHKERALVKARPLSAAGGRAQAYNRVASFTAGLPALRGSEPGQVRKEAATAILRKCRG